MIKVKSSHLNGICYVSAKIYIQRHYLPTLGRYNCARTLRFSNLHVFSPSASVPHPLPFPLKKKKKKKGMYKHFDLCPIV